MLFYTVKIVIRTFPFFLSARAVDFSNIIHESGGKTMQTVHAQPTLFILCQKMPSYKIMGSV